MPGSTSSPTNTFISITSIRRSRPPTRAVVSEELRRRAAPQHSAPRAPEVLTHPRYRLHIFTSRVGACCGREHRWRTPLGYPGGLFSPMPSDGGRWAPGWSAWCFPPARAAALACCTISAPARCAWTPANFHPGPAGELLDSFLARCGAPHSRRPARRLLGRWHHRLPPAPELRRRWHGAWCCTRISSRAWAGRLDKASDGATAPPHAGHPGIAVSPTPTGRGPARRQAARPYRFHPFRRRLRRPPARLDHRGGSKASAWPTNSRSARRLGRPIEALPLV